MQVKRKITEFRLHGRGGQGIVVAASIFAEAVFLEGHYARAFSLFGAERRGAPVTAFIRAGSERLMPRSRIYQPDYVVVFDASISGNTLFADLKGNGTLIINAGEGWPELLQTEFSGDKICRIYQVEGREIAWKHKLTIGSFPMVNTVMLGAMAKVSGLVSLKSLTTSIEKRIAASVEANIRAAGEGFDSVREVTCLAADRK
jgi:2-oxoacid:acceptor oxidoreductase gamma subunit (pyruvate/2-ketoisovalerate family)